MALLVTTCQDRTPQLSDSKFSVGLPTIELTRIQFDLIIFNRFLAPAQGKHGSGPKFHAALQVLTPNHLPPSCLLAGFVFDILLRPSSFTYANSVHLAAQNIGPG